ncbi:dodecin domain-containing protein [Candidatus Sumerlaeota bacterium]|nr:dodecin domain-containing protein [Candidatus Sumerlaeota bacterium]
MFKMIEVVGTSGEGFSEATKDAVNQIIDSGETVHFFEVVEERGSVRKGKFKEYQVKLKVALEVGAKEQTKAPAQEDYCPTCHQVVGEDGHLCAPTTKEDTTCEWCGALIPNARHLCNDKIKEIAYICNSCGRTAVKPEHLCNPIKIK